MSRAASVLLVLTAVASSARAGELDGTRFEDKVRAADADLVLNGMGLRKATIFRVKAYSAALYVPQRTRDGGAVLAPTVAKQFVAVFRRDIGRERGADALREGIERSAGAAARNMASEVQALVKWMPAVAEGDRLVVTYYPGKGVELKLSNKADAFHGSVALGNALFGMWVGPRSVDDGMKSGLLGG